MMLEYMAPTVNAVIGGVIVYLFNSKFSDMHTDIREIRSSLTKHLESHLHNGDVARLKERIESLENGH